MGLVGYQNQLHLQPTGRSIENLFNRSRASICINPDSKRNIRSGIHEDLSVKFTCQGNPFSGHVDFQHFDLDHIANCNDLVGVTHVLISQLRDVN